MSAAAGSKEAVLLPSHTGPHQSPSCGVPFPVCVTGGKRHSILTLHKFHLLPGNTQPMSSVGLLPPLGCQNGVQNSRIQGHNPYCSHLCWASYWYQKKDLKLLGITLYLSFELPDALDLGEEWMVSVWYASASCRDSQESRCDRILHLFRDYCFCTSCDTTVFEGWLWRNSGQVLLCHVERDDARQPAAQAISPAKWHEKLVGSLLTGNICFLNSFHLRNQSLRFPWPADPHSVVPSATQANVLIYSAGNVLNVMYKNVVLQCKMSTACSRISG